MKNKLEEIKCRHQNIRIMSHTRTHSDACQYENDVKYLLAALEEAQQQVNDLKEDKRKIFVVHDEQCARSSEYYNELIFVKGKLKDEEREKIKYKEESERLNEICRQLAGEEMMFQEGQYETEMQSLENKLAEAQQTIARKREALIATGLPEWAVDAIGGGETQP